MNKQEMVKELRDIADAWDMRFGDEEIAKSLDNIARTLKAELNPIQDVVKLNEERYGLTFNPTKATEKLDEELAEFKDAVKNNDIHEMVDALNDLRTVAIGEIRKMGYDPILTLNETVKEISSRKQDPKQKQAWKQYGILKGDKWQKDVNQCSETIYKADFSLCKLKD